MVPIINGLQKQRYRTAEYGRLKTTKIALSMLVGQSHVYQGETGRPFLGNPRQPDRIYFLIVESTTPARLAATRSGAWTSHSGSPTYINLEIRIETALIPVSALHYQYF